MTGSAQYHLAAEVAWVTNDEWGGDEAMVVAVVLPDGAPMVFQDSAAAIWRAADGGGTADQIVARVALEAQVEAAEIATDVQEFLDALVGGGFLARSET